MYKLNKFGLQQAEDRLVPDWPQILHGVLMTWSLWSDMIEALNKQNSTNPVYSLTVLHVPILNDHGGEPLVECGSSPTHSPSS